METKKCPVCQKEKDIEEFRRLTGLKNKFNKLCKECIAPHKARYEANKEPIKEYQKEYREENRDYFRSYRSEWNKNNKELVRYAKNQAYDTDAHFKKRVTSRATLRSLITKGFEFEAVLGCSFSQFKAYMESKFQPGMSWENYGRARGQWSIDHIVPLIKTTEGFNANHYTNLQPLWVEENSAKSDKVE